MALVRFKLDPKGAEPERPAPVAPAPAAPREAPRAPAPSPARPAVAVAAAAPARRRGMVLALALVGLLLVGGAGAGVWVMVVETYPEKYLVKQSETPNGIRIANLRTSEMEQLGIHENPGEIDRERLEDDFATSSGRRPEDGWAEVLQSGQGRIALFALRYDSPDDAKAAGRSLATACGFANGAILREKAIVVMLVPEGAQRSAVLSLVDVLRGKSSGLTPVCGTA